MDYVNTKTDLLLPSTKAHLAVLKNKVKFNKKVIDVNYRKVRFIRKLLNKILSKAPKHLHCHQLQKLLYKNCKNMQAKMQSFVNASPKPNKTCMQSNTRKRKRNHSILEDNDISVEELNNISLNSANNISLNSANNISLNSTNNISLNSVCNYDSDETDEELHELEAKHIRVNESLQKIAKIRKLPDYKRIEKILNMNDDASSQKRKRSLNSIVLLKNPTPFWNTYSYLLKEIENCVAKKYWNKLTTLLIYLSSAVKKCEPLLLKATIINFISNPTSETHESLEGFLKECYSCQTEEDIENLLTQLFHIKPKTNTSV